MSRNESTVIKYLVVQAEKSDVSLITSGANKLTHRR